MAEEDVVSIPEEEIQDETLLQEETTEKVDDSEVPPVKEPTEYSKVVQTKHQKMKEYLKKNAPEILNGFEEDWRGGNPTPPSDPGPSVPATPVDEEEYATKADLRKIVSEVVKTIVPDTLKQYSEQEKQKKMQNVYNKELAQHNVTLGQVQREFQLSDQDMGAIRDDIMSSGLNFRYLGGPTAYVNLFNDKAALLDSIRPKNPVEDLKARASAEQKILDERAVSQPGGSPVGMLTQKEKDENEKRADAIYPDDVPL